MRSPTLYLTSGLDALRYVEHGEEVAVVRDLKQSEYLDDLSKREERSPNTNTARGIEEGS